MGIIGNADTEHTPDLMNHNAGGGGGEREVCGFLFHVLPQVSIMHNQGGNHCLRANKCLITFDIHIT